MAAINVIFVLLTAILPPLMFLIIFVLPLTSTVVTLFCQKRYFPIYFIATIALCLITTSGIYIFDTFFYVIPSLITGFLFGLLIEKRVPAIYIILVSTILQYALTFLTFIILNSIVPEINFIDALLNIFGLGDFIFKDVFVHLFLFVLSSIQTVFTYVFLKREIRVLGFEFYLQIKLFYIPFIIILTSCISAVIFIFLYQPLVYVFILIPLGLVIYLLVDLLYSRRRIVYILLGISTAISIAIFGLCYQLIPHPIGVILIAPLYVFISAIYFANNLFINKTKFAKINN